MKVFTAVILTITAIFMYGIFRPTFSQSAFMNLQIKTNTPSDLYIVSDSLRFVNDLAVGDSSVIYRLFGQYESGYIFAKDTLETASGTLTDSIRVSAGQVRYAENRITAIDTLWSSVILKDNANSVYNLIAASSATTDTTSRWWLFDFMSIDLLKLELINTVKGSAADNRVWHYGITLRKRSKQL